MSIKVNSIRCPECGALLQIEEGRTHAFCSYCGTKVIVTNENEHIYRHIDEAEMKQAETDRIVRMKALEIEESQQKRKDRIRSILTYIWIGSIFAVAILCIYVWVTGGEIGGLAAFDCMFYVGGPIVGGGAYLIFKVLPDNENSRIVAKSGGIRFPKGLEPFSDQHVDTVEQTLRSAGFWNITTINMHDVTIGLFEKPGRVESISVNSTKITSGGKYYYPDDPITITYHGR